MLAAVMAGTACGAVNGIFTIQRRRGIRLVTALSSLLVGAMASGLAAVISTGGTGQILFKAARGTENIIAAVWIALAVGLCFAGAVGGGNLFSTNEGETTEAGGSIP